jgi:hypothetical protein
MISAVRPFHSIPFHCKSCISRSQTTRFLAVRPEWGSVTPASQSQSKDRLLDLFDFSSLFACLPKAFMNMCQVLAEAWVPCLPPLPPGLFEDIPLKTQTSNALILEG